MNTDFTVPDIVVYDKAQWQEYDERDVEEKAGYPFSGNSSDLFVLHVIPDTETFERPTLCVVVERRDAWVPTGEQRGMFRPLSATEVEEFRASAMLQFENGAGWGPRATAEVNPLWHPVVREEIRRLEAEEEATGVCPVCDAENGTHLLICPRSRKVGS